VGALDGCVPVSQTVDYGYEERQQWADHLVSTMPVIKGSLLPCPPTQPDGTQLRPHERSLINSAPVKASTTQTDLSLTWPYALKRVAKRLEFMGSTAKMCPIVKTEQQRSAPNFDLTYTRNAPSQDNASGDHYGGLSAFGYVHDVNDDNVDMRRKSADDVAVCCAVRSMSMDDCSLDSPTMRASRRLSSGAQQRDDNVDAVDRRAGSTTSGRCGRGSSTHTDNERKVNGVDDYMRVSNKERQLHAYNYCDKTTDNDYAPVNRHKPTSGRRERHSSVCSSSDSENKHPRLSSGGRQSRHRHRSGSSGSDSSGRRRRRAAFESTSSSASRSGSRQFMRCDKFDGKTCVDTYLANFESCAEYNNWTVKDKAVHLKSALTGNAANLLQGNARATYDEMVELLQRRYGNSQQHEKFKLELKSRRRRPDEDIQSLAQEVERLVHRAYPRAPADLRETHSLDSFIDALDDPPLQCRLREREPVTLNKAVATALRLKAINVSTLRGKGTPRKQFRRFRAIKTDHADEGRKRDSPKRPSPNSAEKPTSAGRGKRSPKKEQPATAETQRAFRGQLQLQDKEISRLREKLVEMRRAGSTPSTPSKAPASPLLVQAAEPQPTMTHRPFTARHPPMSIRQHPIRHSQCRRCLSRPEMEFRRSVRRLLLRYLGQMTL